MAAAGSGGGGRLLLRSPRLSQQTAGHCGCTRCLCCTVRRHFWVLAFGLRLGAEGKPAFWGSRHLCPLAGCSLSLRSCEVGREAATLGS